jgi:hypothetical protein
MGKKYLFVQKAWLVWLHQTKYIIFVINFILKHSKRFDYHWVSKFVGGSKILHQSYYFFIYNQYTNGASLAAVD